MFIAEQKTQRVIVIELNWMVVVVVVVMVMVALAVVKLFRELELQRTHGSAVETKK